MANIKKFRLWYPDEKRMVLGGMLTFDLRDGKWMWEGRNGSFHSGHGKLMEGTGIEIKGNKDNSPLQEIFEGDILEISDAEIVTVIKNEVTGNFCTEPEISYAGWGWDETMTDHRDRVKIVGNIYEKPISAVTGKINKVKN
jgi:hypothetical protein